MTLSITARAALAAEDTDEVFVTLLTLDNADFASPVRVCSNSENVISNGNTFVPCPFDLALPDSPEEGPSTASLVIENVSREIIDEIRLTATPITVLIEIVLASSPNTIELALPNFLLRAIEANAETISGELLTDDTSNDAWPTDRMDPGRVPGIF